MNNRLRLALQKKGRLAEESLTLLQQCGLKFRIKPNALITHIENFPIDLLFVRDDDIPTLVLDGLCDGGIVGQNMLYESSLAQPPLNDWEVIAPLAKCTCRLSIAVNDTFYYKDISDLSGKRIATSYPNLLQQYLQAKQIKSEILTLSGSVEVAPRMGMADAICDLVSTGQTLEENQLKEVQTIMHSEAVLIKNKNTHSFPELFTLLARRIKAVQQALERKYIVFHAPFVALSAIAKQLPGAEAPTIVPLPHCTEKVAVHVVSTERIFWNTLERIQQLGASSILVLPIEQMLE
ncbi:MAG: ATP phosphoribosyltransferase [Legionella sp. 40-6]|nr:MAG: ATP phosphoribosyltransferase [Legionella sp. 40-6]